MLFFYLLYGGLGFKYWIGIMIYKGMNCMCGIVMLVCLVVGVCGWEPAKVDIAMKDMLVYVPGIEEYSVVKGMDEVQMKKF